MSLKYIQKNGWMAVSVWIDGLVGKYACCKVTKLPQFSCHHVNSDSFFVGCSCSCCCTGLQPITIYMGFSILTKKLLQFFFPRQNYDFENVSAERCNISFSVENEHVYRFSTSTSTSLRTIKSSECMRCDERNCVRFSTKSNLMLLLLCSVFLLVLLQTISGSVLFFSLVKFNWIDST